jgi:hypothetical protein
MWRKQTALKTLRRFRAGSAQATLQSLLHVSNMDTQHLRMCSKFVKMNQDYYTSNGPLGFITGEPVV